MICKCGGKTTKCGFNAKGQQRYQCKFCKHITLSEEIDPSRVRTVEKLSYKGVRLSSFQGLLVNAMINHVVTKEEIARMIYGRSLEYVEKPFQLVYAHIYELRKKGIAVKNEKMKGYSIE